MNYSLFDFLKLIGSLGFFLFGMKLMSESLQKVAGEKMRSILSAITSNRFKGILTGVLITAIIQSSSATTVMVVSFVNAGLLTLVQSISVIMGANIGTTVTAWLISLLGFKVNVTAFALPLIGLAIPFIFSKNPKRSSIGQLIIGFSVLFMGLGFLKDSVPDINGNPEILGFITQYSSYGFFSILIFLMIGTILTIIIQSSSAVMALTLVMCFNGWINYEMAAAMVLGENIGTTITANLAAIVVNDTAKRAARSHFLFNLTGVVLVLIFFNPFLKLIDWTLISFGQDSVLKNIGTASNKEIIPIALSVFHSFFNILNTSIQVWFIPQIAKAVIWLVPQKDDDDEMFKLQHIKTGLISVDEIGMIQAKNEVAVFIERTIRMYNMVKDLSTVNSNKNAEKLIARIRKYEEISDNLDEEIVSFLTQAATTDLSKNTSDTTTAMIKLVNKIESLNDSCLTTAELLYTKRVNKIEFNNDMNTRLNQLWTLVDELVYDMKEQIQKKQPKFNVEAKRKIRDEIELYVDKLNLLHLKDIKKGNYKYKAGIVYCDTFTESAAIGNNAYHVLKYINELNL